MSVECELTLPFFYVVQGKPFRKVRPRRQTVIAFHTIDVASARGIDAPVAARWSSDDEGYDPMPSVTVRCHEGKLYRPLHLSGARPITVKAFTELLSATETLAAWEKLIDRLRPFLPMRPFLISGGDGLLWGSHDSALAAIRGRHHDIVKDVSDDEMQRAEIAAISYGESLLAIDGTLWTTVDAEPSWRVFQGGPEGHQHIYLSSSPVSGSEIPFRADEKSDALVYARERARANGALVVQRRHRIDIRDSNVLRSRPALICEGMLDALRGYDEHRVKYIVDADPWSGCCDNVRRYGAELLEMSRTGVWDEESALAAIEKVGRLVEALKSKPQPLAYVDYELRVRLQFPLKHWQDVQRLKVQVDEEDDAALQAFGF